MLQSDGAGVGGGRAASWTAPPWVALTCGCARTGFDTRAVTTTVVQANKLCAGPIGIRLVPRVTSTGVGANAHTVATPLVT